jgi:hypothetical protein
VLDLRQLDATLDLWACMWEPDEQTSFETALVRSMTDAHPINTRLQALAACHVIGTPRLLNAAARMAESGVFTAQQVSTVETETVSRYNLMQSANRMRGKVLGVELLLARVVSGHDPAADQLLDWVDLRDLVAAARTSVDVRLYREVERRVARRGKYQRGRAANVLGFKLREPVGDRVSQSPEIGDLQPTGT